MKISEASELLDCSFMLIFGLINGVFSGNWNLVDDTFARIERIHEQIDERKKEA